MSVFAPFVFMAAAFGEIDIFKLFEIISNMSGLWLDKLKICLSLACIL